MANFPGSAGDIALKRLQFYVIMGRGAAASRLRKAALAASFPRSANSFVSASACDVATCGCARGASSASGLLQGGRRTRVNPADRSQHARASRAVVTQQQEAIRTLELKPQFRLKEVPQVRTDAVGAISMLSAEDLDVKEGVYENVDGRRFEDGRYKAFMAVRLALLFVVRFSLEQKHSSPFLPFALPRPSCIWLQRSNRLRCRNEPV